MTSHTYSKGQTNNIQDYLILITLLHASDKLFHEIIKFINLRKKAALSNSNGKTIIFKMKIFVEKTGKPVKCMT